MIKKEEGPFNFKIIIFLTNKGSEQTKPPANCDEIVSKVKDKLVTFGADQVYDLKQNQNDFEQNPRIRVTFVIPDREKALECYQYFSDFNNPHAR